MCRDDLRLHKTGLYNSLLAVRLAYISEQRSSEIQLSSKSFSKLLGQYKYSQSDASDAAGSLRQSALPKTTSEWSTVDMILPGRR
jgi:hypothetical protein